MTTSQLECFISLAGTLNYMKTAEQLGLTQPAVSKQIQSLETELNCKLFNRSTRSVTLTKAGTSFLADANTIIDTFYHSKERISNYQERELHSLKIGYMDPHTIYLISRILKPLFITKPNLIPEFTQEQTDANLSRLANSQLDLIIGIKDAKFKDSSIHFTKLYDEELFCVTHKESKLAQELKKQNKKTVTTNDLWQYRQIISVPPYLIRNLFSRRRYIVPVNEDVDNAICTNANEAYGLLLANFGYALLAGYEILEHRDLVSFKWEESPHAPFGIYSKASVLKDKASIEYTFIQNAKEI
ncbi:MAG: LysR family transcriptional regulator [Lachnospiraceae bacterium]|nr:LysR family transcriptional regulator [Lachnospiraceae bacterium]